MLLLVLLLLLPNGFDFVFPLLPNGDEDEEEDDDDFDDCFLLSPFANGLVFGTPLLPPEKEGEFAPPLFLLLFGNPPLLDEPNPPNLFFCRG